RVAQEVERRLRIALHFLPGAVQLLLHRRQHGALGSADGSSAQERKNEGQPEQKAATSLPMTHAITSSPWCCDQAARLPAPLTLRGRKSSRSGRRVEGDGVPTFLRGRALERDREGEKSP